MRKFPLLSILIFLAVYAAFGPSADAETLRNTAQNNQRTNSTGDPLAPFLGNPGRSVSAAEAPSSADPLEAVLPAWAGRQEPSSESKLGWALWEMTQKTGEAARTVKDTVKTSITDYVKDKAKQSRQQDLIEKFYTNLHYVTGSLNLAPHDQQELTSRVQRAYIEDAESGRYEFDSLHFRELPYIVRKEYADMVLLRTKNGEAETYHLNGTLKTRWTFKNGQPDGPIVTYYENGDINFIDVFKEGRKIRRTKYDTEGKLVFEQNYEYSLPEEKSQSLQDANSAGKEAVGVKAQEPAEEALRLPPVQDQAAQLAESHAAKTMPETAPDEDTSGLVELPPQVSVNHIEV